MPDLIIWILIFMIIAAVVSLWTDDLLSAVIAFGAVGFGSSLLFLLLSAPDLAITQIVVEVVTLVLLIRATIAVGIRTAGGSRDVFGVAAAGALVLIWNGSPTPLRSLTSARGSEPPVRPTS